MFNIETEAHEINSNDFIMSKNMADALHRHYPGHCWAVTVEGSKGIATIRNLMLSGNYGVILKLPAIYSGSAFEKDVIRAGGEILERYRLNRGRVDAAQYANLPTDFAGNIHFDK